MLRKHRVLIEVGLFLVGFVILWHYFTNLLQPKYLFDSVYVSPETEMWTDFYRQEKDSIDVLYIGSSHIYNDVNPIVIYEKSGLTGFDMATSAQDMATAYFLLQEALRFQKPQCIVLDVYGFHFQSLLLTENYKKTLDNMRWSSVKLSAIEAWQKNLKEETLVNRIFTLLDFHARWSDLNDNDYNYQKKMHLNRGFAASTEVQAIELIPSDGSPVITLNDTDLSYLDSIIEVCQSRGIHMIMIATPHADWKTEEKELIADLAAEKNIEFFDFNESSAIRECGLDCAKDFRDRSHLNVYGAQKFSAFLAERVRSWNDDVDEHSEQVYKKWDDAVTEWNKKMIEYENVLQSQEGM